MQLANARKAAGAAVLLSLKSGGEKNVFRFQTEIFIRATFHHAFRQRFEKNNINSAGAVGEKQSCKCNGMAEFRGHGC